MHVNEEDSENETKSDADNDDFSPSISPTAARRSSVLVRSNSQLVRSDTRSNSKQRLQQILHPNK
jgi:hypothetical protein